MIKRIIILSAILISVSSFSQKNNISPYSFFGIGEMNDAKTVHEQSMGGIGTAINSFYRLSFSNPASLGSLKFTTYTLAGTNKYITIDDGTDKQGSSAFSLSYLALGFPVGKNGGMAFGLQPYAKVGYHILDKITNSANETESNLFRGEGGSNRVFLGYGYKLPYKISLGAEGSYIFGNTERTILHRNEEHRDRLATRYAILTDIKGFSFKVGAQNSLKLNDKLDVKTGISLLLESSLSNKGNESIISLQNTEIDDFVNPKDELLNQDYDGEIIIPIKSSYSIGAGKDSRWFAGFEYSMRDPLRFTTDFAQNNNAVTYDKSTKMAFGGFFTPKANSITNYWSRVTYTAGVHTEETGLVINNTPIKDFGMSFGVSLPSKRKLSNVNIGFDIGNRGEVNNNALIKENYYNFRLSLSLNDKWFKKRKLD